eukprot:TRINITY_DN629_c10_g1_i1.p1 TRINITY_DN629_c10_g1~~TRINITY_DN629_c10_g1_i1.p1  ORF type:complete len:666 (+),score=96.38 TRINITY_DN629_c10_g1_i1:58-1998(+)
MSMQLSAQVHGTVTTMTGDGDSVLVVMKDKGVRVHYTDAKDREWPVKTGSEIVSVCSHKFGNVVAQKRYMAAVRPDHLVTWSAGFDKAVHLAPGIHVGSEVTHILPPQVNPATGFLRTQAVAVFTKGADFIHIFNPYTTELAGPLSDPFDDGADGEVIWAAAGVEIDDESYFVYAIRKEARNTVRVYRVLPRSFTVLAVGKYKVEDFTALHLEANQHWVLVTKNGVVKQSPVAQGFDFKEVKGCEKLNVKSDKATVAFTDENVANIVTFNEKTGVAKALSIDLTFSTQSGSVKSFTPIENAEKIGSRVMRYATLRGQHWLSVDDKIFFETSEVGAKTLAGAMLKSDVKKQPHATVIKIETSTQKTQDILSRFKTLNQKPVTVKSLSDATAMLKSSTPPSLEAVKKSIEICIDKKAWKVLASIAKTDLFVLTPAMCGKLLPFLVKEGKLDLFRSVTSNVAGALPSSLAAEVLQIIWEKVSDKPSKTAMAMTDTLLSCGRLPDPVDTAVELSEGVTKKVKLNLLKYFYLRLVLRAEYSKPQELDSRGVPQPETLSHWLGSFLDGNSGLISTDTEFHPLILSLHRLTYMSVSTLHLLAPIVGQLTVFIGTPTHRHAAIPEIDSKDLSSGPLKPRSTFVSQPVARYTLAC